MRGLDLIYIFVSMQPKTHKASFLIPGLVSYEQDGEGVWLLQKSSVDACVKSFIGKPVQIGHEPAAPAVGYVCGVYFDDEKGVYIADLFLLDEQAETMVSGGSYYPSCAYTVLKQGGGGVYNCLAYSTEILELRFDHLAIVDNPRYTCGVFFKGEKPNFELKAINSGGKMAVKNEAPKEGEEKKEETAPAAQPPTPPAEPPQEPPSALNAVVEIDGKKISVADLVDLYRKSKTADNEGEQVLSENETLDIDGETVNVSELIALWRSIEAQEPTPPTQPAQNSGGEKEIENGKKTVNNGIVIIKTAVSNSAPKTHNSKFDRLPNESKQAYNERINKMVY